MRLLVDANLSARIVQTLRDHGHDAVHVIDVDLQRGAIVSLTQDRLRIRDLPIG